MKYILNLVFLLSCPHLFGQYIFAGYNNGAASFPTASVLDTFTRANENPLSDGGKWTCGLSANLGVWKIVSNQALANSIINGLAYCYWNNATFGPEEEIYVTIPTLPASNQCIQLWSRLSNPNTMSTLTGYFAEWCNDAGTPEFDFNRIDAGFAPVQLGSTISGSLAAGDSFGLLIKGSTLTLFKEHSGVWSTLGTTTDSTYSSAGNIAIAVSDTTTALTNFGGGTGTE